MSISARAVLFDLDGTLVDPAGAITGGILSSLLKNGVPDPGPEVLRSLVGPPLAAGLLTVPGVAERDLPRIIADYRAVYAAEGMATSRVYPGVPELLDTLLDAGAVLAVATSKPTDIARRLLDMQGLADRFGSIHGSDPNELANLPAGHGKAHIVRAALEAVGTPASDTVMVGDRRHDAEGAAANGLACLGVAWGFAGDGELEAAGVRGVARTAEELTDLLLGPIAEEATA